MKKILLLLVLAMPAMLIAEEERAERQEVVRCEAITKAGTRCKRKALAGKKYCKQHQRIKDREAEASNKAEEAEGEDGPNSFSRKTIRKGGNGERGVSWTKKN